VLLHRDELVVRARVALVVVPSHVRDAEAPADDEARQILFDGSPRVDATGGVQRRQSELKGADGGD
jgi:hypothetical protein